MADIDVVKKSSHAWIWILMIVILALVAWFVMRGNRTRTVGELENGGPPQITAVFSSAPAVGVIT